MITIIDYGVGNLGSVEKAFHFIGQEAMVTSDPEAVQKADAVVLPGVGAYADAMKSLKNAGMVDAVKQVIRDGKLFLGICLGMQLLFEYSEEGGGQAEGLGIYKGAVRQLPMNMGLKVPHMGWNSLNFNRKCTFFHGLEQNPYVYFVHSYYLEASERDMVTAATRYGIEFDVAINRGRVYATQFHPEKSGRVGLEILKNWARLLEAQQ